MTVSPAFEHSPPLGTPRAARQIVPAILAADLPLALFAAICGVLGLLVGSFLNVVIHRLPMMMDRDWRNHCAELQR
jgi:hypothetical protein